MADARLDRRGGDPLVTIAMPALNEAANIRDAVLSVLPPPDGPPCELLVLDGGSADGTCRIVQEMAALDPRIRLVRNPLRIQSCALNLASRLAHPSAVYLVRADCHAAYPPRWVEGLIDAQRCTGAASIVVPLRTLGRSPRQRAFAAAQNTRLGNGGAAHRNGHASGYVTHGHHALFLRQVFLHAGGYDETFSHNEDAELDRRLCAAGHAIFLAGYLPVAYYPRGSFHALARQYFNYGRGCARTLTKHRALPRLRQWIPPAVLLGCAASLAVAPFEPTSLGVAGLYVGLCLMIGLGIALRQRDGALVLSGPAAVVMHLCWAAGFLSRGREVAAVAWARYQPHLVARRRGATAAGPARRSIPVRSPELSR